MSSRTSSAIRGATVIARNYWAHARVLGESFLEQHPGASFSVLVVDDSEPPAAGDGRFELLSAADVGVDAAELARRATMYTAQGMVASMKADVLRTLIERTGDAVVLLDADGCVYGDLSGLAQLARRHALVLSPHALDPHPLWLADSPEQIIFRAGINNAGLLAVGPEAVGFLRWWGERTARRCVFDEPRGLMLSQTWLTVAMALFEHHLLRDRGCNVAGWNLQARDVAWEDERPTIDGGPLRHFHFACSFDPQRPELLTTIPAHARWWPALSARPGVARLARAYAERLLAAGYARAQATPPAFDTTPGGAALEPWMRDSYRLALLEAEQAGTPEPPNPFADGDERFLEWARAQAERAAAPRGGGGGEQSGVQEAGVDVLADALLDRRTLLARIAELERDRDETAAWAASAGADLKEAARAIEDRDRRIPPLIAERDRLREALLGAEAVMGRVRRSRSWRMTAPLRAAAAAAGRLRGRGWRRRSD